MNVLMITGDRNLLDENSGASKRLALQRSAVDRLDVVYWGQDALTKAFRVRGAYDVVTSQDPLWRGLVALYLARKLGATLNVQVHLDLKSLSWLRYRLARTILLRADTIRVVSQRLREAVEEMGSKAKVVVLPVFVDVSRFRSIGERAAKTNASKTILWTGRFEEEKNPQEALRIFTSVKGAGIEAELVMLGDGSMDGSLRALAQKIEGVRFPGWQDPLPYLKSADVVVCTSRHESWGASIVEALAAGVPVVAPDVGIAKDAGAVVVERDKLAEAVIDILKRTEKGTLKLTLLPASEWAEAWRNSLI